LRSREIRKASVGGPAITECLGIGGIRALRCARIIRAERGRDILRDDVVVGIVGTRGLEWCGASAR
jgi:hypothetical protein